MTKCTKFCWDGSLNPNKATILFSSKTALLNRAIENAHPCLRPMDNALHQLTRPILCLDEMSKLLSPLLMFISTGELFDHDHRMANSSCAADEQCTLDVRR